MEQFVFSFAQKLVWKKIDKNDLIKRLIVPSEYEYLPDFTVRVEPYDECR